jgi:hypothetical protein
MVVRSPLFKAAVLDKQPVAVLGEEGGHQLNLHRLIHGGRGRRLFRQFGSVELSGTVVDRAMQLLFAQEELAVEVVSNPIFRVTSIKEGYAMHVMMLL